MVETGKGFREEIAKKPEVGETYWVDEKTWVEFKVSHGGLILHLDGVEVAILRPQGEPTDRSPAEEIVNPRQGTGAPMLLPAFVREGDKTLTFDDASEPRQIEVLATCIAASQNLANEIERRTTVGFNTVVPVMNAKRAKIVHLAFEKASEIQGQS